MPHRTSVVGRIRHEHNLGVYDEAILSDTGTGSLAFPLALLVSFVMLISASLVFWTTTVTVRGALINTSGALDLWPQSWPRTAAHRYLRHPNDHLLCLMEPVIPAGET